MELIVEESPPHARTTTRGGTTADSVPQRVDIDRALTVMERRKTLRRWRGFRSHSTLGTPLVNALCIYLVPFLAFNLGINNYPSCKDRSGATKPCEVEPASLPDNCTGGMNISGHAARNYYQLPAETLGDFDSFVTLSSAAVSSLVVLFVTFLILLWCTGGAWAFRWWVYVVSFLNALLMCIVGFCSMSSGDEFCGDREALETAQLLVTIMTSSFLLLLMVSSISHSYLVPYQAQRQKGRFADVRRWYRVKELRPKGNADPTDPSIFTFEYYPVSWQLYLVPGLACWRPAAKALSRRRALFSYAGDLDGEGRPHGVGRWRDTQYKGESLKGLWRHGEPIGPFIASEQGTGFGFRSVQIAFATCCANAELWDATKGDGHLEVGALHWGVAATETSINGHFYSHLPEASLVIPPTPDQNAKWALEHLVHLDRVSVSLSPRPRPEEALLFIHGWKSGHNNAHLQLAQFLNMSRLDARIEPFVFAWPCGASLLSFPRVARFCTKSTETHAALASMIASLKAAGIRKLHIWAHSMGARLLCNALPRVIELLAPTDPGTSVNESEPCLQLSTCTLLHPEHDLHTFIARDFAKLRNFCPHITIYLDQHDQALGTAEVLNHQPSLGKHPLALVRQRPPSELSRQTSFWRKTMRNMRGYHSRSDISANVDRQPRALDLDVIDTSWMEVNAVGPRHGYFNVNRWLVDDLAEIITTGKRAAARVHRLVKFDRGQRLGVPIESYVGEELDTNVFVFLAAPSWIGT